MSKEIKGLVLATILIVAIIFMIVSFTVNSKVLQENATEVQYPVGDELPSINNATSWLNSKPLKAADLQGKVVLVNFCTYSCINWLRTLPYLRSWEAKYKDHGLVVIGVHTPEFSFEKSVEKVRRALNDMNITYPVALDSDYTIWNSFNNKYWPAFYFIDAQGITRHEQFGEGDYDQSEKIIQQLLAAAGASGFDTQLVSVNGDGIEAAPDLNNLLSNENYLGYQRTQNFSSPGYAKPDKKHVYEFPTKLMLNHWALNGNWRMQKVSITLNNPNGRIIYRFHSRDLHLVMGTLKDRSSARFQVLIDGQPPGAAHGTDVDEQGYGTVTTQRLYQLVRQPGNIVDRQFEVIFFDSGVEAFAFTFG